MFNNSRDEKCTTSEIICEDSCKTLSFVDCIAAIKRIINSKNTAIDGIKRFEAIETYLLKYFESEVPDDLFEGFLRMVKELYYFTQKNFANDNNGCAKKVFQIFFEYLSRMSEENKSQIPSKFSDQQLVLDVLRILSNFKPKYIPKIDQVFHLHGQNMFKLLLEIISFILERDVSKAIQWMDYFDMRDHFPLEIIVSKLLLINQFEMLKLFSGSDLFRKKKVINFLDNLLWKNKGHMNELDSQISSDPKKIEKIVTKLLRHFQLDDSNAPHTINFRCREGLLYHHYRWKNGEISFTSFEEIATHTMQMNLYVRNWYLDYLCRHHFFKQALLFSMVLGIRPGNYNEYLIAYSINHPDEFQKLNVEIQRDCETRRRNQELESEVECKLKVNSSEYPVILVDTWTGLEELIWILRKESIIGLDAEWRPHFISSIELIALFQISTSKSIYLVDVITLENIQLTEKQWISFFEALFCTESLRKIGYDFRNDMRVIKSTFPFITKLYPRINGVICMYRLFTKLVMIKEAKEAVFGAHSIINLSLSDMSKFFLDIDMDKTERIGNWTQRPLRYEQKQYAALDAFCLIGIFKRVSSTLIKLGNRELLSTLQNSALMVFEETEKLPLCQINGQTVHMPREGDKEFIQNISEASSAMLAEGSANMDSKFRTVEDVKFVVDSMLFGLGKALRKCGFDTKFIQERMELIEFCQENKGYIALSTGKGYKQIALQVPGRSLCLPVDTRGQPQSQLVKYIMNQLSIVVKPGDLQSRCVECNTRCFVRIPRLLVKVLYYMFVSKNDCTWLEISEEDADQALAELRNASSRIMESSEALNTVFCQKRYEMGDEEFYIYSDESFIICQCKCCCVDIINKLMLAEIRDSPIEIKIGLKFKKESFSNEEAVFYVCADCGKVELFMPLWNDTGSDQGH